MDNDVIGEDIPTRLLDKGDVLVSQSDGITAIVMEVGEGSESWIISCHLPGGKSAGAESSPRTVMIPASGPHQRGSASVSATRRARLPSPGARAKATLRVKCGEAKPTLGKVNSILQGS